MMGSFINPLEQFIKQGRPHTKLHFAPMLKCNWKSPASYRIMFLKRREKRLELRCAVLPPLPDWLLTPALWVSSYLTRKILTRMLWRSYLQNDWHISAAASNNYDACHLIQNSESCLSTDAGVKFKPRCFVFGNILKAHGYLADSLYTAATCG
jgi:hypothetical protein